MKVINSNNITREDSIEYQEPVAWIGHSGNLAYSKDSFMPSVRHLSKPLYTAPPIKPWLGFTKKERQSMWADGISDMVIDRIESALKEKNNG